MKIPDPIGLTRSDLGLERVNKLLLKLGNPQKNLQSVHIAGTNGKGSVAAMVFAMLSEAGYRTGMYTSPHLVSYAERFRIGGLLSAPGKAYGDISETDFNRLLAKVQQAAETVYGSIGEYPTWFETLTAIAFLYFVERKIDWAVLEVGMGGRLDATNMRDWDFKIITDIGLDHTQYLGQTIRQIAGEKAAIIHQKAKNRGKNCLVTSARRVAFEVLSQRAELAEVGLWRESSNGKIRIANIRLEQRQTVADIVINGEQRYRFFNTKIPLLGRHQVRNAALAIGSVLQMRENGDIAITDQQIRSGLLKAHWSGRCEIVDSSLWPEGQGTLLLDGAHNAAGVSALVNFLEEWQAAIGQFSKINVIFASKQEKKVNRSLHRLEEIADCFLFCGIHALVPTHDPNDLANKVFKPAQTFILPSEALAAATQTSKKTDLTIVCGSLYLLGEIKKILQKPPLWQLDQMEYNADARR